MNNFLHFKKWWRTSIYLDSLWQHHGDCL